jgi:hypothetical protein
LRGGLLLNHKLMERHADADDYADLRLSQDNPFGKDKVML